VNEGVLDVNMMYRPLIGDSIAEYDVDGGRFYHRAECIIEVNSWLLMITLATSLAFLRSREPSDLRLDLKIHMEPTILRPGVAGIKDHVPFLMSVVNSSSIAARHSRCFEASE